MNTPYNKDLVIDDGLTTTIRNVFVVPFNLKIKTNSLSRILKRETEKSNKETVNMEEIGKSSDNDDIETCENAESKIYVISDPKFDLRLTVDKNIILPNCPDEDAFSSVSIYQLERRQSQVPVAQKALTESDLEDNDINVQDTHLSMGKRILGHMVENINDEEYYLHYFIQLINLEDTIQSRGMINFEIMHIAQSKVTLSKKGRRKNNLQLETGCSKKAYPSSPFLPHIVALKNNLSGDVLDRIKLRKLILNNFDVNCNDEESYNKYLTELIDFEEEFVED